MSKNDTAEEQKERGKSTVQEQKTPSLDDVWDPLHRPGDYEFRRPIPEKDPKCPNCGHPFEAEEWGVRHLTGGPSLGEDWHYTCPKCNNETLECGT